MYGYFKNLIVFFGCCMLFVCKMYITFDRKKKCDKWVHIACNNLKTYIQNSKKITLLGIVFAVFKRNYDNCSIDSDVLNSFMHRSRILSPNLKFISSVIKQSEFFDEEILKKFNNKYYTPTEFNNALNELSTKKKKKTFTCT